MGTPDEVGGRGGLRLPGLRPRGIEDERGVGCTSFCGVVLWPYPYRLCHYVGLHVCLMHAVCVVSVIVLMRGGAH